MSDNLKVALIVIAVIVIGGGAFTYGALTAPKKATIPTVSIKPSPTVKVSLNKQLETEQPIIQTILTTKYPKITTDYAINQGKLYGDGNWYGTTLTYKGTDNDNRDTLRVLFQKQKGAWIIRTTPPQPLLSTVEYPDVPKSILQAINKPISLPASTSTAGE
jgi:hypothetical protein